MDRRRTDGRGMDAEGGRRIHGDRRSRKLAVVIAVQNVLVAACLLVTLYVYLNLTSPQNVHIQFEAIADIPANETLKFTYVISSNMMSLVDEKNDMIYVNCTGPYILYTDVCYKSMSKEETRGMLQLQVQGSSTPVSSLALNTSHEVCRGLHSIAYLKATQQASLYFYCTDGFKIKNVTQNVVL
ncbi:hypothetical protein L3Q82_008031 [Scortum barcoo]|uniref:Uncharacterized protein n=1 Tax=Scortum barcoo TaxID=214431 RepID=A0ACB8WNQ2_9TELE|nr:hypothetical protein L3Q82_008031 [Scortum barcoo]